MDRCDHYDHDVDEYQDVISLLATFRLDVTSYFLLL